MPDPSAGATAPLRVALSLGRQATGGIARFAMELALALDARDDVALLPIGPSARLRSFREAGGSGAELLEIPGTRSTSEAGFVLSGLGRRVADAGADVLHCTKHVIPLRSPVPTVLTVHDLSLLRSRTGGPDTARFARARLYERSIRRADRVVTVSRQVREAVQQRFPGVEPSVVPHAVPVRLLTAPPERVAGLEPGTFALFVGDLNRRKNLSFLLDVWHRFGADRPLQLVAAGGDGRPTKDLAPEIRRAERAGVLRVLGSVDDDALRWLYEAAAVVCVPSLDEGFGLPVVEAAAFGTPVIASALPIFTDLAAARPGVRLEPLDPERWVSLLREPLGRVAPAAPGPTWADVAAEYVGLYRETLATRPRRTVRPAPSPASQHPTIVLDCRWLSWSGAGTVTTSLARGLAELQPPHEWVLWGPEEALAFVWPGARWVRARHAPTTWRGQRDWWKIPKADLVVFMHQQRPLRGARAVSMIYDTQPLRFNAGRVDAWQKRHFLRRVAHASEHVLTISEFSRRSIERDLGVRADQITAVQLAIDPAMADRVLAMRTEIDQVDVAIYVGLFLEHKNLPALVTAFGRTRLRAAGGRLLLVGGKDRAGPFADALTEEQRRYVDVVPFASQPDLERHLAEARLLVQPSLEEGFGLPVAEALAAGLDVCAADAGAIPEAARGHADLFDPRSIDDIVAAIDRTAERSRARTDHGAGLARAYRQDAPTDVALARQVVDVVDRCL